MSKEVIKIQSRDYWIKIVEMLQHNWALIEENSDQSVTVYFITDASTVFGQMDFASKEEAKIGLRRNGFERYEDDPSFKRIAAPPPPPFTPYWDKTRNIYSSGKFWK